jgi:hypothetical protein
MRYRVPLAIALLLTVSALPLCAYGSQDNAPTQQSINNLAARASHAQPRDQCFLYAQLVRQMTELMLRQYAAGDVEETQATLHGIQQFVQKIHLSLAADDKRLKKAQILLSQTAFRLKEMLHESSFQDRPLVAQTLAQVNHAQDEALMQLLQK